MKSWQHFGWCVVLVGEANSYVVGSTFILVSFQYVMNHLRQNWANLDKAVTFVLNHDTFLIKLWFYHLDTSNSLHASNQHSFWDHFTSFLDHFVTETRLQCWFWFTHWMFDQFWRVKQPQFLLMLNDQKHTHHNARYGFGCQTISIQHLHTHVILNVNGTLNLRKKILVWVNWLWSYETFDEPGLFACLWWSWTTCLNLSGPSCCDADHFQINFILSLLLLLPRHDLLFQDVKNEPMTCMDAARAYFKSFFIGNQWYWFQNLVSDIWIDFRSTFHAQSWWTTSLLKWLRNLI